VTGCVQVAPNEGYTEVRRQSDFVVVSYHGGFEKDLETGDPTEAQTGENEGYYINIITEVF
jgi:2',3'-cyclic-nucleotide 2'-phosphodiesterase/3'-nucleotidase